MKLLSVLTVLTLSLVPAAAMPSYPDGLEIGTRQYQSYVHSLIQSYGVSEERPNATLTIKSHGSHGNEANIVFSAYQEPSGVLHSSIQAYSIDGLTVAGPLLLLEEGDIRLDVLATLADLQARVAALELALSQSRLGIGNGGNRP